MKKPIETEFLNVTLDGSRKCVFKPL